MYTLLLVDDEPLEREALRLFVTSSGLPISKIIECSNGDEAFRAALRDSPQLCVFDIRMPGRSGLDLLEELNGRGINPKVIFQTAYSDFNYAVKALHLGAFEYLLKPARREEVVAAIRRAIDGIEHAADQTGAIRRTAGKTADAEIALPKSPSCVIEMLRSYIIDKYSEHITLDRLAGWLGFNKYYIAHLFKEFYGKTIMDFVHEVRMVHAKELLSGTELRIAEIAYRLGYSDPNYFISVFKKYTGISPGVFRTQNMKE